MIRFTGTDIVGRKVSYRISMVGELHRVVAQAYAQAPEDLGVYLGYEYALAIMREHARENGYEDLR